MNNDLNYRSDPANCTSQNTCAKMPEAFPPQHQDSQPGL